MLKCIYCDKPIKVTAQLCPSFRSVYCQVKQAELPTYTPPTTTTIIPIQYDYTAPTYDPPTTDYSSPPDTSSSSFGDSGSSSGGGGGDSY